MYREGRTAQRFSYNSSGQVAQDRSFTTQLKGREQWLMNKED